MSETLFSDCNFVGVKLITHKKKGTLIMKRTLYLLTAALLVVFASCVFIDISSLLRVSDAGCRSVYLNRINISFDGRSAPSYAFYRTNVDATCIDFNNMNYYYGRERKYIVDILPNDPSAQIYGYVPVEIHIEGIELDTPSAITHQNRVTYTQRFVANISVVGETQDLLND